MSGRARRRRAGASVSVQEAVRARVVRALRPRVRAPSEEVRQAAAAILGEVGGPAALEEIARLLSDRSDRVRRAAVLALGRASGTTPRELAAIRRYLGDPAPRVRAAAAVVLGRRQDRGSVGALLARLRAPGTWEKPSVAVALGRIGDRRAVGPLTALARSPERWLRVCALHGLGEIGSPDGRAAVRSGLADPAWSVRGAAATALATLGTPRDVPRLFDLLDDPHPWPRRGAIYALARLGRHDAAGRIRAALADPTADVRVAACWALGELRDARARRPLARFLARCPMPQEERAPSLPSPERELPPTGAEARQFETAVAALARIGPAGPGTEVDRALAEAERRLAPEELERVARPAFAERTAGSPVATLRQLFEAARSVPAGGAGRR